MLHIQDACFHSEDAAYDYVESRVWPNGPVCPHCGSLNRSSRMRGASTRIHTYKCYECRKPFTVKIGTVFEASHVPLHLWLQAIYLMAAGQKRMTSYQLHRILGVTLRTAMFMVERIQKAGLRRILKTVSTADDVQGGVMS